MALTLVPSTLGYAFGFSATPETGCNVEKFEMTVKPEIDEYLPGPDGQAICNAVGDPMGDLTISGEKHATSGIFAAVFTTAFVPQNAALLVLYGRSAGGWYLKEGMISFDRGTWNKGEAKFSSRFNIA